MRSDSTATTASKKKILLAIDQRLISIVDVILRLDQVSRTAFINSLIKNWIKSNKKKVQEKLKEYQDLLNTP